MSKKPILPAELMAHHLDYRASGPQAEPRCPQGKSAEALLIVQRIHQRQAYARAIRASEEWNRPPEPDRIRRLAVRVGLALAALAAGALLVLEGAR